MSQRSSDFQTRVETLALYLRRAERIVFLTGAGMSTESGIPDFRSSSGIYATVTSEEVFDLGAFRREPGKFFAFARSFFPRLMEALPNEGHKAIVTLQEKWVKDIDVATQNIDVLHQRAGTGKVHALHGTTETCTCLGCGQSRRTEAIWPDVASGGVPRHGGCGGVFKPDIVFFGEMLPEEALAASYRAVQLADLLVVCGTSLAVYPAGALPSARGSGCGLVIVNRTPTPLDGTANLVFREGIGMTLATALATMDRQEAR